MASWKRFFHRTGRGSRALGLGVTLALAGFAMLAPGGCTLDRQGLSATGGSASTTTTTVTTSTSTSVSTTTSTSTGSCTTGGGCTPCTTGAQCPAPSADGCAVFTCVGQVCTPKDTTGMPSTMQTPNDCKKNVCGADGKPASQADPLDLPADDGNACTDQVCVGDKPMSMPVAMGTVCNNGTCDDKGNCFNCMNNGDCTVGKTPTCDLTVHTCISCSDNIQNGTETTPDCGGICKSCIAEPCAKKGDCISNQCADMVCCNTDCAATCQACNLPGTVGTCSNVPVGQTAMGCSSAAQACDGAGTCKKSPGTACANDGECSSNQCLAGLCRTETGGACNTNLVCASGLCTGNVCVACAAGADCPTMMCNTGTGVCKTPGGAACDSDTECAIGVCLPFRICQVLDGGACAKAADCRSGVCKANTCVPCSGVDLCSGNATCGSAPFGPNTCKLPAGAYCFNSGQCVPGNACSGYPATCQ